MDFKNLSKTASGLAENMSGLSGQNPDKMLDNLFPKTGYKISKEEFIKMEECANMLEKYVSRFPKESGVVSFDSQDMNRWKNDFFKTLVHGGPELPDDQFYTGKKETESAVGIGTDGAFTCEELFQFLYRLYNSMASYKIQSSGTTAFMQNAELFGCTEMLEKYVDRFPKARGCVKLEGKDASDWKDHFFPELVEGGPKLPDYSFFNSYNKNYGIGMDGEFSAAELFQFMYRLYKEIVNKLG